MYFQDTQQNDILEKSMFIIPPILISRPQ